MRSTALLLLGFASLLTSGRAGSVDAVIIQTMGLAEAPNYSWITTVSDNVATFTMEGRTQPAGFTWVKMPMMRAVARHLGQSGGGHLEAVFIGRDTFVLRISDVWVAMHALPWAMPGPDIDTFALARGRPGGRMGTLGAPLPTRARSHRIQALDDEDLRLPGNVHLGLTPPHEELGVIVSSFVELHINADLVSGTLSELGAALLLIRDRQVDVTPVSAQGSFRLWFKDGQVAQYQLRLDGILAIGRKTSTMSMLTTTMIKQIGNTSLEVPDEARALLEQ